MEADEGEGEERQGGAGAGATDEEGGGDRHEGGGHQVGAAPALVIAASSQPGRQHDDHDHGGVDGEGEITIPVSLDVDEPLGEVEPGHPEGEHRVGKVVARPGRNAAALRLPGHGLGLFDDERLDL